MSIVTKAANAHWTVATGWSTPENAYATTTDGAYATLLTAKNGTRSGDFGFPAFTTADIPDGATINSVAFSTTYGLSATATGALVGEQARRNSTAETLGSEITRTAASQADASGTATGATLDDLRTAGELRVRARATKGNSTTAVTARIDRLYVTVDYTEGARTGSGDVSATLTLSGVGRKTGQGAGSAAAVASLAGSGTKTASGSGGVSVTAALAAQGSKVAQGGGSVAATLTLAGAGEVGIESHAGAGAVSASFSLAGVGAKLASCSGSVSMMSAAAGAGRKVALGAGALDASLVIDGAGSKTALGAGAVSAAVSLVAAGTKYAIGYGSTSAAFALAGGGEVVQTSDLRAGAGSVSGTFVLVGNGAKTCDGSGALDVPAVLWGDGTKSAAGGGGVSATFALRGNSAAVDVAVPGSITATIADLHRSSGSVVASDTRATIEPLHYRAEALQ